MLITEVTMTTAISKKILERNNLTK